jgi:hypothetical protein
MVASIAYYPFGVRESITLPGLDASTHWALFIMPLVFPIYLLILSILGFSIALKRHQSKCS